VKGFANMKHKTTAFEVW